MKISLEEFLKSTELHCRQAGAEPVEIEDKGQPGLVLLSAALFQKFKASYREALFIEELDPQERNRLAEAPVAEECCRFDDEFRR